MTKVTKRLLFYLSVIIFLVVSYVVILYAQGYKYSFSENNFFKTGAVYLKVNTDSNIYLNDKFLGNTSFFGNSYRSEGLLPADYIIKVQKDGYSTWQKNITVDEGFVSEFSKILLLPEDNASFGELYKEITTIFPTPTPTPKIKPKLTVSPTSSISASSSKPLPTPTPEPYLIKKGILSTSGEKPEKVADNVKGFILSNDKNKLAWWTGNNEVWVMWLNDSNYQPYHKKGDKELITKFSSQIKKAAWFRDEDHLILDSNGYKVIEIDTRGGINVIEV